MAAFQFYLQSEKQIKVGWMDTTFMLFLAKKIHCEEESEMVLVFM
jgi:hypothetical protein